MLMSLAAMAIDSMLPALPGIGADLGVVDANDTQLVVSGMFLGLALAQVFFGPLSDSVGRKPALYLGLGIFVVGSALAAAAASFTVMLVARVLQGIGAAGPRVIAVAMVRDRYEGRRMARVMSLVMSVFVLVPAVAPSIGQAVLELSHWRVIFLVLLAQGVVSAVWLALRQPETLPPERRLPLSPRRIGRAMRETCTNRVALGYTVAAGFIVGALLAYLSSAQQIFVDVYHTGSRFPLYFGALALTIGAAAVVNSRLVERLGMRLLCLRALVAFTALSVAFTALALAQSGPPHLVLLMAYLLPLFFCVGILFGNFNALALEPLGHIAGTAAAVVASLSTLMGIGFGVGIGRAYDGTVTPLAIGFTGLGAASLTVMWWTERGP